jgi:hypothetical protein
MGTRSFGTGSVLSSTHRKEAQDRAESRILSGEFEVVALAQSTWCSAAFLAHNLSAFHAIVRLNLSRNTEHHYCPLKQAVFAGGFSAYSYRKALLKHWPIWIDDSQL